MEIVAVVLTALSIVFAVAMPLCAAGLVRRNRLFGLRFWPITGSDAAWRIGHRAATAPAAVTAAVSIIAYVLSLSRPDAWTASVLVLAGLQIGGVAWATAAGTRAVHRADRSPRHVAM